MPESSYLKPYEDLIYTRLDLPQSPTVSTDALTEWLIGQDRIGMIEQQLHAINTQSNAYPWKAIVACKNNQWDKAFAFAFPELVEYTKHFPTTVWRQISIIAQLPDSEVFLHTDPDKGMGWRLYLSHGGPKLYFQKFKKRRDMRPQTWSIGGPEHMQTLCSSERIYVQDEGCYPWALTATRAAHGVSQNPGSLGSRVTMLLFPEPEYVDQLAHTQLLKQSTEKHHQTAIWY